MYVSQTDKPSLNGGRVTPFACIIAQLVGSNKQQATSIKSKTINYQQ